MLYTALLVVLFCATCFINVQSLQFLLEPIN